MTASWRALPKLALRNVRRQVRRSLLTGAAMALGVAVFVFSRALADGGHEDWIEAGVRLGSGHIAMQSPGYHASKSLDDRLSYDALAQAKHVLGRSDIAERVMAVATRLEVQALAQGPTAAVPVMITGVVPDVEREFSRLGNQVEDGRYLERGDRLHAYVGVRLAERLELRVGSRLVLTAQGADGEITGQFVRVAGIFRSGLPEADEGIVQIPLSTAREWLGVGESATTLAVLLESGWIVSEMVTKVRDAIGTRDDVRVLGWREAMPELEAGIKVDDWGGYVFHVVLFGIIALAIVNTVLMSVLHRTREFGVLRALGLTQAQTASVVLTEGVILTVVSGLLGLVVGVAFTWIFFRNGLDFSAFMESDFTFSGVVLDTVIVPVFRWQQVAMSLGAISVIGVFASLYPAYRATQIDVAAAMKFEA
jgi:ABC-type lipoprotein release transport system permease subunit